MFESRAMKVKLFIDGQNFYRSMQRAVPLARIDYNHLASAIVESLSSSASFAGAHYYIGIYGQPDGMLGFLKGLELQPGYFVTREELVRRVTACRNCGGTNEVTLEKGVDTRLSVDMVAFAAKHACEAIVLLSGDEDFVPAIQAVNSFGVQSWVATWGNELSANLRRNCYGHIDLRSLPGIIKVNGPSRANDGDSG